MDVEQHGELGPPRFIHTSSGIGRFPLSSPIRNWNLSTVLPLYGAYLLRISLCIYVSIDLTRAISVAVWNIPNDDVILLSGYRPHNTTVSVLAVWTCQLTTLPYVRKYIYIVYSSCTIEGNHKNLLMTVLDNSVRLFLSFRLWVYPRSVLQYSLTDRVFHRSPCNSAFLEYIGQVIRSKHGHHHWDDYRTIMETIHRHLRPVAVTVWKTTAASFEWFRRARESFKIFVASTQLGGHDS